MQVEPRRVRDEPGLHHVDGVARADVHGRTAASRAHHREGVSHARGARAPGLGRHVRAMRQVQVHPRAKRDGAVAEVRVQQRGGAAHRGADEEDARVAGRVGSDEPLKVAYAAPPAGRVLQVVRVRRVGEEEGVDGHAGCARGGARRGPLLHAGALSGERDEEDVTSHARRHRLEEVVGCRETVGEDVAQRRRRRPAVPAEADPRRAGVAGGGDCAGCAAAQLRRQLRRLGEVEGVGAEGEVLQRQVTQHPLAQRGQRPSEPVGLEVEPLQPGERAEGGGQLREAVVVRLEDGERHALTQLRGEAGQPVA
mmetsp:Transcript_7290/g.24074  ORF Transcript_7290/g.24074 Transcript_7290/m.24074 type:complete len:310 (-) Transcript_7290:56-985(-)